MQDGNNDHSTTWEQDHMYDDMTTNSIAHLEETMVSVTTRDNGKEDKVLFYILHVPPYLQYQK